MFFVARIPLIPRHFLVVPVHCGFARTPGTRVKMARNYLVGEERNTARGKGNRCQMIENTPLRFTNSAPPTRRTEHVLLAPASCRRFSGQSPKIKIGGEMSHREPFLIETRKRLKIAATQTKQSSPVTSNRVRIAGIS